MHIVPTVFSTTPFQHKLDEFGCRSDLCFVAFAWWVSKLNTCNAIFAFANAIFSPAALCAPLPRLQKIDASGSSMAKLLLVTRNDGLKELFEPGMKFYQPSGASAEPSGASAEPYDLPQRFAQLQSCDPVTKGTYLITA